MSSFQFFRLKYCHSCHTPYQSHQSLFIVLIIVRLGIIKILTGLFSIAHLTILHCVILTYWQRHTINTVNRCLRYILRIWWPNIISNKDLWKVTGQEDINVEIRKRKFRWIGHTLRNENREIPKAALLWNPRGNRKTGRPRNSWRRSVIKEACRSWSELRFLAADRQKWKGLKDNLCS